MRRFHFWLLVFLAGTQLPCPAQDLPEVRRKMEEMMKRARPPAPARPVPRQDTPNEKGPDTGLEMYRQTERESGKSEADAQFIQDLESEVAGWLDLESDAQRAEAMAWLNSFRKDPELWQELALLAAERLAAPPLYPGKEGLIRRAVLAEILGDKGFAARTYLKAVELSPDNQPLRFAALRVAAQSHPAQARALLAGLDGPSLLKFIGSLDTLLGSLADSTARLEILERLAAACEKLPNNPKRSPISQRLAMLISQAARTSVTAAESAKFAALLQRCCRMVLPNAVLARQLFLQVSSLTPPEIVPASADLESLAWDIVKASSAADQDSIQLFANPSTSREDRTAPGDSPEAYLFALGVLRKDPAMIREKLLPLVKKSAPKTATDLLMLAEQVCFSEKETFAKAVEDFIQGYEKPPSNPSRLRTLMLLKRLVTWRGGNEEWLPMLERYLQDPPEGEKAKLSPSDALNLRWMAVLEMAHLRGDEAARDYLHKFAETLLGPAAQRRALLLGQSENKAVRQFTDFWQQADHNPEAFFKFYDVYREDYAAYATRFNGQELRGSAVMGPLLKAPWPKWRELLIQSPLLADLEHFDPWIAPGQNSGHSSFFLYVWGLLRDARPPRILPPPAPDATFGERLLLTAGSPDPLTAVLELTLADAEKLNQFPLERRIQVAICIRSLFDKIVPQGPPRDLSAKLLEELHKWVELSSLQPWLSLKAIPEMTTSTEFARMMSELSGNATTCAASLWEYQRPRFWEMLDWMKHAEALPPMEGKAAAQRETSPTQRFLQTFFYRFTSANGGPEQRRQLLRMEPDEALRMLAFLANQQIQKPFVAPEMEREFQWLLRTVGGLHGDEDGVVDWRKLVTGLGGSMPAAEGLRLMGPIMNLLVDCRTPRHASSAINADTMAWIEHEAASQESHAWPARLIFQLESWWSGRQELSKFARHEYSPLYYQAVAQFRQEVTRQLVAPAAQDALLALASQLPDEPRIRSEFLDRLLYWGNHTTSPALILTAVRTRVDTLKTLAQSEPYPAGNDLTLYFLTDLLTHGKEADQQAARLLGNEWLEIFLSHLPPSLQSLEGPAALMIDLSLTLPHQAVRAKLLQLAGSKLGIPLLRRLIAAGAFDDANAYWQQHLQELLDSGSGYISSWPNIWYDLAGLHENLPRFISQCPEAQRFAVEALLPEPRDPGTKETYDLSIYALRYRTLAARWPESQALEPAIRTATLLRLLNEPSVGEILDEASLREVLDSLPDPDPAVAASDGLTLLSRTKTPDAWARLRLETLLARKAARRGDWNPLLERFKSEVKKAAAAGRKKVLSKASSSFDMQAQSRFFSGPEQISAVEAWWGAVADASLDDFSEQPPDTRRQLRDYFFDLLVDEDSTYALAPSTFLREQHGFPSRQFANQPGLGDLSGPSFLANSGESARIFHLLALHVLDGKTAAFEERWAQIPQDRRKHWFWFASGATGSMDLPALQSLIPWSPVPETALAQRWELFATAARTCFAAGEDVPLPTWLPIFGQQLYGSINPGDWNVVERTWQFPTAMIEGYLRATLSENSTPGDLLKGIRWAVRLRKTELARTWAAWLRPKFPTIKNSHDPNLETHVALRLGDLEWARDSLKRLASTAALIRQPETSHAAEAARNKAVLDGDLSFLKSGEQPVLRNDGTQSYHSPSENLHLLGITYAAQGQTERAWACFASAAILHHAQSKPSWNTPQPDGLLTEFYLGEADAALPTAQPPAPDLLAQVSWQSHLGEEALLPDWMNTFLPENGWIPDSAPLNLSQKRSPGSMYWPVPATNAFSLRAEFTWNSEAPPDEIFLQLGRSPGSIFYINGQEILRNEGGAPKTAVAPPAQIFYSTLLKTVYRLPHPPLRQGRNIIACTFPIPSYYQRVPFELYQFSCALVLTDRSPLQQLQSIDRSKLRPALGEDVWQALPDDVRKILE